MGKIHTGHQPPPKPFPPASQAGLALRRPLALPLERFRRDKEPGEKQMHNLCQQQTGDKGQRLQTGQYLGE